MRLPIFPDVKLRTLRLRGPAEARHRLVPMLDEVAWPALGEDEWVFVRHLAIAAPLSRIGASVANGVANSLRADTRDVKRFSSRADMLAALFADVADGSASKHWYWREWLAFITLPRADALRELMLSNLEHLCEVSAALAGNRQLQPVWLSLEAAGAGAVCRALASFAGHSLSSALLSARSSAHLSLQHLHQRATPAPLSAAVLNTAQAWSTVLHGLQRGDARRMLAAQLIALQACPLSLMASPDTTINALNMALPAADDAGPPDRQPGRHEPAAAALPQRPIQHSPDSDTHDPEAHVDRAAAGASRSAAAALSASIKRDAENAQTKADPLPRHQPVPLAPGLRDAPPKPADLSLAVPAPQVGLSSASIVAATTRDQSAALPAVGQARSSAPAAERPDRPEWSGREELRSAQGGLFYLCNMLNRAEARAIMLQHAAALPSGWAWLYHLGVELGLQADDPVCDLLAARLGLDDHRALAAMPPMPAREALLGLALRWYAAPGLWSPGLLHLPARMRVGPAHIDLHCALSDVRIDVRLAGLDVDPGWLPWLGCVVRFHYD